MGGGVKSGMGLGSVIILSSFFFFFFYFFVFFFFVSFLFWCGRVCPRPRVATRSTPPERARARA
jgi:hypothetical protein